MLLREAAQGSIWPVKMNTGHVEIFGTAFQGRFAMTVQVITRDGEAEYAVVPWADYQALLEAAGRSAPLQSSGLTPVSASVRLDQLRDLREAKGLAAEQLARTVGISPHYLAMIESGERQPDAAIRRALAWNLGIGSWES